MFGACSSKRGVIKSELEFANKLAKEGLWKEAHYRWTKVLKEGKETASLYNNIAIALEKMGRFDEAEDAYKKAISLAPGNPTIQSNYNKLKRYLKNEDEPEDEDMEKSNKKRGQDGTPENSN